MFIIIIIFMRIRMIEYDQKHSRRLDGKWNEWFPISFNASIDSKQLSNKIDRVLTHSNYQL